MHDRYPNLDTSNITSFRGKQNKQHMTTAPNCQPPTHLVHGFSRDRGARPLRTFPNAHLTSLEIAAACKIEATDARLKRGVSRLHCRTLAMKRGCRARHTVQRSQLSERLPVASRQLSGAATELGPRQPRPAISTAVSLIAEPHCSNEGDLLHPGQRVRQSSPRLGL